jgi:hypothetical protein
MTENESTGKARHGRRSSDGRFAPGRIEADAQSVSPSIALIGRRRGLKDPDSRRASTSNPTRNDREEPR